MSLVPEGGKNPVYVGVTLNCVTADASANSNGGELQGVMAWMRDISSRKVLEDHLTRTRHMASVGTLAAGVAHHFNNIACGMGTMVEFALATEDPGAMLKALRMAAEACTRISWLHHAEFAGVFGRWLCECIRAGFVGSDRRDFAVCRCGGADAEPEGDCVGAGFAGAADCGGAAAAVWAGAAALAAECGGRDCGQALCCAAMIGSGAANHAADGEPGGIRSCCNSATRDVGLMPRICRGFLNRFTPRRGCRTGARGTTRGWG